MAGNAVSFTAPLMDDKPQQLLYKIAVRLYAKIPAPTDAMRPRLNGDTEQRLLYRIALMISVLYP